MLGRLGTSIPDSDVSEFFKSAKSSRRTSRASSRSKSAHSRYNTNLTSLESEAAEGGGVRGTSPWKIVRRPLVKLGVQEERESRHLLAF